MFDNWYCPDDRILEIQASPLVRQFIFGGAVAFVPLSFLILYMFRNDIGKRNLVRNTR